MKTLDNIAMDIATDIAEWIQSDPADWADKPYALEALWALEAAGASLGSPEGPTRFWRGGGGLSDLLIWHGHLGEAPQVIAGAVATLVAAGTEYGHLTCEEVLGSVRVQRLRLAGISLSTAAGWAIHQDTTGTVH